VILYELVSGRRPYPPETPWQERLTRKVPPVHPRWDVLLARCLDPDPAHRFRNAEEVAQALSPSRPRRWFLQVAAAAVIAVTAGGVTYQRDTPGESGLLAVIPFVNASHTPESEYLSDGLSEGLINALVQLPDLKVIARSSSFKFKGDKLDVHKAARTLGAQVVVTGRVAEMGGRLRITTELVNGADGTQIWGAQYNCALSDLSSIQAEISRQIAERIRSKLTPSERLKLAKGKQVNPEAYELLLRGRYQMRLYTPESREKAVGYFQQALAVDPGFSLAHAELAAAYRVLSASGILDSAEALPQAEAEARRALAADADLAEAHAALAGIKRDRWDWTGAEGEYRMALALSPNLTIARTGLAICLSVTGKYDAAITEIQHSRELDPIGLPTAVDVAAVYYNTRHYDQAAEALQHAASLDPSSPTPWMWMGMVKGGSGRFSEAVAAYEKAIRLGDHTGAIQCLYAHSLARSGRRHQALQILDQVRRSQVFVPLSALAFIYTGLNDKESAIRMLQAAYAARDPMLQYLQVESHYDILKDDPRFQDLAIRIGLPR
jgi:TolB-like protein/Tfp pilus assembly protein PilF